MWSKMRSFRSFYQKNFCLKLNSEIFIESKEIKRSCEKKTFQI